MSKWIAIIEYDVEGCDYVPGCGKDVVYIDIVGGRREAWEELIRQKHWEDDDPRDSIYTAEYNRVKRVSLFDIHTEYADGWLCAWHNRRILDAEKKIMSEEEQAERDELARLRAKYPDA